jgi:hypothetical protein
MPTLSGGTPTGLPSPESGLTVIQRIVDLVLNQLQDETATTWPPDKMLPYLTLALNEIVNLQPEANPQASAIKLIAGATQSIDGIELMDAVMNMGTTGITPGKAIRTLSKAAMDLLLPDWATWPVGTVVLYVMIDPRNPKVFYTIPPMADALRYIQIIQSEIPDEILADDQDFPLDDSFIPACVDYMIYRCLDEATTIPGAQEKANKYLNKFFKDLGIKTMTATKVERQEKVQPDAQAGGQ